METSDGLTRAQVEILKDLMADVERLRAENEGLVAWASEERNKVHRLHVENERLLADNADMRRMLTSIIGDDEYLRIYAIEEAKHHPALADQGKG